MKQIILSDLLKLAIAARPGLTAAASSLQRPVMLYLHWTAGHYGQFFDDYHIQIDKNGEVYITTEDFTCLKAHTWHRNTGALGIALACAYQATTADLGEEPPTPLQIEALAQVIAVVAKGLDIPIQRQQIMTHAECADEDGYGPSTTCERWDLWFLQQGDAPGSGGEVLRGKSIWYQQQGIVG